MHGVYAALLGCGAGGEDAIDLRRGRTPLRYVTDALRSDPRRRLGCARRGRRRDAKRHPRFRGVDFDALVEERRPATILVRRRRANRREDFSSSARGEIVPRATAASAESKSSRSTNVAVAVVAAARYGQIATDDMATRRRDASPLSARVPRLLVSRPRSIRASLRSSTTKKLVRYTNGGAYMGPRNPRWPLHARHLRPELLHLVRVLRAHILRHLLLVPPSPSSSPDPPPVSPCRARSSAWQSPRRIHLTLEEEIERHGLVDDGHAAPRGDGVVGAEHHDDPADASVFAAWRKRHRRRRLLPPLDVARLRLGREVIGGSARSRRLDDVLRDGELRLDGVVRPRRDVRVLGDHDRLYGPPGRSRR